MAEGEEQGTHPLPVYNVPQIEVTRQKRCTYDDSFSRKAIVIDNGSYSCKAGWAGEEMPRLQFRSLTCRPKNRNSNQQRACVGDWGTGLKGWDFGKHTWRGIFDGDIPYQLEAQEQLLDWTFDRLSITGGSVDHPILFTHPPLGPRCNQAALAELLFEAYGVPAVQFAASGPCAFHYMKSQGSVGSSGLVVSSGYSSTYITAMHQGQPQWQYCSRSSICGALATQHLQQLLLLRYPQHAAALSLPVVERLKEQHCYCAGDYSRELKEMQAQPSTAGGKAVVVQLPWTPPKIMTAGEAAAAAAAKAAKVEEQRKRMKDMAARRRQAALEEKEDYLEFLEDIAEGVAEVVEDAEALDQLLSQAEVDTQAELAKLIADTKQKVERLRAAAAASTKEEGAEGDVGRDGTVEITTPPRSPSTASLPEAEESVNPREGSVNLSAISSLPSDRERTAALAAGAETADSEAAGEEGEPVAARAKKQGGGKGQVVGEDERKGEGGEEEVDLLGIPDSELSAEQKKLKRRQQLLKAGREARARAKTRKEQEEKDKAARAAEEDAAHAADPEGYLAALRKRHAAVSARLEAKKRKRLGFLDPSAQAAASLARRGRRTGAEQRERMRLMVQAVQHNRSSRRGRGRGGGGSSDSEDSSFGEDDDDWDVYKHMRPGGSDSDEGAEDEAEFARTSARLCQLGALHAAPTAAAAAGATPSPSPLQPSGTASAAAASPEPPGLQSHLPWAQGTTIASLDPAVAAGLVGVPPPGMALAGVGPEGYIYRPLTAEDFQVVLGVERVRIPELLFQPSLVGVDQAGVAEIVMGLLKRMPKSVADEVAGGGLLLTGGNAAFAGLATRLEAELTASRPLGKPVKVVTSTDPVCDAWKGGALLATQADLFARNRGALMLEDYEEKGVDYLMEYFGSVFPALDTAS